MQISKNNSKLQLQHLGWHKFYLVLISIMLVLVWFSQQSINFYWQQTYHQDSPLVTLERFSWWRAGAELQQKVNQQSKDLIAWLANEDGYLIDQNESSSLSQDLASQGETLEQGIETSEIEKSELENNQGELTFYKEVEKGQAVLIKEGETKASKKSFIAVQKNQQNGVNFVASSPMAEQLDSKMLEKNKLQLKQTVENLDAEKTVKTPYTALQNGNKVLFAGDSLMQGLAPQLQKLLKKKFGINSINLSKQSTGLSYPHFFNWPETIEQALEQDPKIKLLIVMLGANDPWDMPNPENRRGAYLKFKSPMWEKVYRQRIQQIVHSAKQHQVQLIWIEVPFIRKNKLNQQTRYLNQLYADEIKAYGVWIPLERYLSGGEDHFIDTLSVDQKNIRVRTKDGIHFTLAGGRYVADYILQYIHYL
ncbi:hypothetical protein CEP48_05025 [Mergibacter septicus]|uniref:DUF459 domain-containing protein n=1 Tax=Mergibacter septicus TaxID=221402 RepID=A0A8E3MGH6_9PAST|nr:SGNH family hydrolase [Mergibacter septicus]AWX15573.1 hypothetical protein CEP47_05025 [Mergibacter septicus]QDJ14827.1 hypothetical protein CEP48_05025 [Mergibacter septicus]UTU47745.1 DUF459 domain-containing protein [Mergibacter septicus]WMR96649.1 SGNH family hydrolase [Mergibacter septicus]